MSGVDLLALAERVEASAGADRELDAVIATAVRYFPKGVGYVWQGGLTPNSPELGRVECCTSLGTGGPHYAAPAYTASLDAAMTLVPEDMRDEIEITTLYRVARVTINMNHTPDDGPFYGSNVCNSIPLAICSAALRARHQSAAGEGD